MIGELEACAAYSAAARFILLCRPRPEITASEVAQPQRQANTVPASLKHRRIAERILRFSPLESVKLRAQFPPLGPRSGRWHIECSGRWASETATTNDTPPCRFRPDLSPHHENANSRSQSKLTVEPLAHSLTWLHNGMVMLNGAGKRHSNHFVNFPQFHPTCPSGVSTHGKNPLPPFPFVPPKAPLPRKALGPHH